MSLLQIVLILARLGQYAGTSGLFGGAFFLACRHPDLPTVGECRLLIVSGLMLMAAAMVAMVLQAADMAGGADPSMMAMVLTSTSFGHAGIGRLVVVAAALLLLLNQSDHLRALLTKLYERLLLIKLAFCIVTLGLAALHRWRLTPRLETARRQGVDIRDGVIEIRRSIALETVSAVLVLGLVAWFGTLAPPNDG